MTLFPSAMNKITFVLFLVLCSITQQLFANAIPELLSYQGRIVTSRAANGVQGPIADGTRSITFKLFNQETGGTAVWTEVQPNVNTYNGEFTVLLGQINTVDKLSDVFAANSNLWLEFIVSGQPPISPRQRLTTTGYTFRARSADQVTAGTDLRFLPSSDINSPDYGLGLYNADREFNNINVNGPVLFGQSGGALGYGAAGSQSLALSWNAHGNVGIGAAPAVPAVPPAVPPVAPDRLTVDGNLLITGGTLSLGGSLVTTGDLTTNIIVAGHYLSTGPLISLGGLTGTSLSIRPAAPPTASEVAGISASGKIKVTGGGTLNGPGLLPPVNGVPPDVLTIESSGTLNTNVLTVRKSLQLPSGVTFEPNPVIAASKRIVLGETGGGANGWDGGSVATTPAVPVAGDYAATGMKLILGGKNASTDLIGFGLLAADSPFSIVPSGGKFSWYGGAQEIMKLETPSGDLSVRQMSLSTTGKTTLEVKPAGSAPTSLTLAAGTTKLKLTHTEVGRAKLQWVGGSTDLLNPDITIMSFIHTATDHNLADQVNNLGYVGINTDNPKAPLHVRVKTANMQPEIFFPGVAGAANYYTGTTDTGTPDPLFVINLPNNGIHLGSNGGNISIDGASAFYGDTGTISYTKIGALFEGEIVARRMWFGGTLDVQSDARAKHIFGRSDATHDLATLMRLEVTNYRWIDRTIDGHRPHKRLIAQQVEATYPQATRISPASQAIPNVYEPATKLEHDKSKGTLTITTKKPHDFKVGDLVDLMGDKRDMKETPVKAVLTVHSFVVDCAEAPESLFVYGKHVSDFRTVDYDAVSMLNVSATQALKRQHDDLEAENAKLRDLIAAQETSLAKREAAQRATEAKFKALEARLLHGGTPQAAPAKTAALSHP